jgi:hypothetical protein
MDEASVLNIHKPDLRPKTICNKKTYQNLSCPILPLSR